MDTQASFTTADWDEYARCYDTLHYLNPYQALLQQVSERLRPGENDVLLDIGCGTGNLLDTISNKHPCSQLIGIDRSPSMLERARSKCSSNVTLLDHDVDFGLPFEAAFFGKVVSMHSLYTLSDPSLLIHEMVRVLKPGGEVVIVTPKQGYDNGLILKEHANDTGSDTNWLRAHASPEREETLIRRAINDEEVVKSMLFVAEYNRRIAQALQFHFFTQEKLVALLLQHGLSIITTELTYAGQSLLVHARKELS